MEKKKAHRLTHKILILDIELSKPLEEKNYRVFSKKLINDLMKLIDMEPLGPLSIFLATDLTEPGWSFIQPITTSHISGHYFSKADPWPNVHVDLYSCKEFDAKKVVKFFEKRLPVKKCVASTLMRTMDVKRKVKAVT